MTRLVGLKYHPCYLVSGVLPTLFSVEPKESLQDLFDREDEVRKLREGLSRERLILVLGLRRIGKSSLVLATLSSTGQPFVYVDVRRAYDEVSRRVPAERLYEELRSSLLRLSVRERVLEALRRMGVSLEYPVKVRVPAEEVRDGIAKAFDALNELGRVAVVLDEAQYLRYSTIGLRPLLAHVYDRLRNVTLIMTGSEVGLLHDFIGIDDPSSPLYGRYGLTIELRPFDEERSRQFLRRGFEELGVRVDERVIERAVEELDGVVGWLVYFGRLYLEKGADAIDEVKEMGAKLVKKELEEALSRSPYYSHIMRAVATLGRARWKNVVDYVTAQLGRRVTNATIARDLRNLVKMGFIEKVNDEYRVADPIVRYAVLKWL
ncbi:MAG: ATP-binding protein [Acidilobus sp.]